MAPLLEVWVQVAFLPEYIKCILQTRSNSHANPFRKIDLFVDSHILPEPILHKSETNPPRKQPEKKHAKKKTTLIARSNPAKRFLDQKDPSEQNPLKKRTGY